MAKITSKELLNILVGKGFLTKDQASDCLAAQKEAIGRGEKKTILGTAVEGGGSFRSGCQERHIFAGSNPVSDVDEYFPVHGRYTDRGSPQAPDRSETGSLEEKS